MNTQPKNLKETPKNLKEMRNKFPKKSTQSSNP